MRSKPKDDKRRSKNKSRARHRRLSTRPSAAEDRASTIAEPPELGLSPTVHFSDNKELSPRFNPFSLLTQVTDHELHPRKPAQGARKDRQSGVCSREGGSVQGEADRIRCPSGSGFQVKSCEIQTVAHSQEGQTPDGEGKPPEAKAKVPKGASETAKKEAEAEASQIGHCDLISFEEEDTSAPTDNPLRTEMPAPSDKTIKPIQQLTDHPHALASAFGFSSTWDDTSPPFAFDFSHPDLTVACKFKFGPSQVAVHPATTGQFPLQKDRMSHDGLPCSSDRQEDLRKICLPPQRPEQRQHQRNHIFPGISRPGEPPTWAFAFLPPPISKPQRVRRCCVRSKLSSTCQPSYNHSLLPQLAELGSFGSSHLQAQHPDNHISTVGSFLPPVMTTSVTETERAIMVPKSTPELAGEWRGSLGNGVFKPKLNVRPRHSRFFPPQDVIKAPMAGKQIQQSPMEAKEELSVAKEALDNQHDHSAVAPPLTIESDHTTMPSRLQPEDTEEWRALLRLGGSIAADYDRCWDQYEGEAGFENVDAEIQDDDWTVLFC